jgi:hypothetical protein
MVVRVGRVSELLIVEGTKQYLAAVSAAPKDLLVVGMAGCVGWSRDRMPNPHLEKLVVGVEDVIIAMDADVARNRMVWDAAKRLGEALEVLGVKTVRHLTLAGAGGTVGLDDYLANYDDRASVLARLLQTAGKLPRPPKGTAPAAPTAAPTEQADPYEDVPHEPGWKVLDAIRDVLTRYVVFPSVEATHAAVLFVAATHAQSCWEFATRMVIKSPIKRCGKSRLQEVAAELVHKPLRTANVSTAALVRSISEKDPPTIILDEADAIFAKRRGERSEGAEDLRGILNAGHSRGVPYVRWNMNLNAVENCPTFAMAIVGGIGDMPDTIEDRAVVVPMRRRLPDETVTPYRQKHRGELHAIRTRIAAWVHRNRQALADTEPELPVEDRAADVWEPLVAIADAAGGDWPDRARAACIAMTGDVAPDTTAGEVLLRDFQTIFEDDDRIFTSVALERLKALEESPWAEWNKGRGLNAYGLGPMLRPYGIRSKNVRTADGQNKGYERADFVEPWMRYLSVGDASQASQASQAVETPASGWDVSGTILSSEKRPTPEQDEQVPGTDGTNGTDTPGGFDFGSYIGRDGVA